MFIRKIAWFSHRLSNHEKDIQKIPVWLFGFIHKNSISHTITCDSENNIKIPSANEDQKKCRYILWF